MRTLLVALMVLVATSVGAQEARIVTLSSNAGTVSYSVLVTDTHTRVTEIYRSPRRGGGDARLRIYTIYDEKDGQVQIYPPLILGPLDSTLNLWPIYTPDGGQEFLTTPRYPLALYQQLYPHLFPKPGPPAKVKKPKGKRWWEY